MPYNKNLEGIVGLFVQEISESTGKNNRGLMGTYQNAPLCQHSVLEFLLGGKSNQVTPVLWIIEKVKDDFILDSSIKYINNKSAHTIVKYQATATFQALIEQELPSAMISLEDDDEFNMGYLIAFIQSTVYYLCLLLNVNWANNPKVVIGKKICNDALMNQKEFEYLKRERENIAKDRFIGFY
jgi:glucose-6-phosphate isomerase